MPIDVHAHYVPPQLLGAVEARGAAFGVRLERVAGADTPRLAFEYGFAARPFFAKLVEPVAARRARLDAQGIDHQLVATWPDIYGYGLDAGDCAAWHAMLNGTLAEWAEDQAGRFSWLASVPLVDAVASAAELARAVEAGAVGVMVPANVEGVNLGEIALDPFWAEAERADLPVIVHPVLVGPAPRARRFGLTQSVQYTFDTTLGAGSLIFSGLCDRFPRLRIVLSHGGGALPYLAGRLDVMHARMDRASQGDVAERDPSAYAAGFHYDTIVHSPKALRFLRDFAGLDRLVLGTDDSFPPADLDPLAGLRAAGLSAADIRAVGDDNPRALFSRLA